MFLGIPQKVLQPLVVIWLFLVAGLVVDWWFVLCLYAFGFGFGGFGGFGDGFTFGLDDDCCL